MEIVARIDAALRAANVPIDGVSTNPDGSFRIDYQPTATAAHKAQATAIIGTVPKIPKVLRAFTAIQKDILALNSKDQTTLLLAIATSYLQENPEFARGLGIAVDGDTDAT